ncbi:hypothetical protein T552_02257 [Pneumocystis carinii B80]|uniref:Proteasome assembly chaperone 1 n=1 Tax=Pneumocystis carinii (strain B80) TaxID=1408658 RepID=A0A0W4ZG02_PNEC8|nr:hypothetical protein T552_02257 [Pneumocystis carinii B80]KTW27274.1 hypothetical protein T552_02257 [Pneumocystis carinii B80]
MNLYEEPPKRYSLNNSETSSDEYSSENESSKEDKVKKNISSCKIESVNSFPNGVENVIIASELFLDILKMFPGENTSQVLFKFTGNKSIVLLSNSNISLYSIIFPNNIPPEMCYHLSSYIFDHLEFKRIFLLATIFQWSVFSPVSFLRTTSSSFQIDDKLCPLLRPPALLSGMEASILSLCEQRNLDAIAIVASSNGPSAHLRISTEIAEQVANILDQLIGNGNFGLKAALCNYNIYIKKRTNVLSMYL